MIDNQNSENHFQFEIVEQGIERYVIDIDALYPDPAARDAFEERWDSFFKSDASNPNVFFRDNGKLVYYSQSLLPQEGFGRPKLMLVFGNPAPHSVEKKAIFSYEGDGKEHRIWKVLRGVGLVDFKSMPPGLTNEEMSMERKKQLWVGEYASPYTLGFISFFSMPSTPSTEPWTGVAGVRRLFGSNVMRYIESSERKRMRYFINNFIQDGQGLVVAFQKDAYNGLRDKSTVKYNYDLAVDGQLSSQYEFNPSLTVYGAGPTRLIHSEKSKALLGKIANLFR